MLYVIIVVLVSGLVALIVYLIDKRKQLNRADAQYNLLLGEMRFLYYSNEKECSIDEIEFNVGMVMFLTCPEIMESKEIDNDIKVFETFKILRDQIHEYEEKHNLEYTIFDISEVLKLQDVLNAVD